MGLDLLGKEWGFALVNRNKKGNTPPLQFKSEFNELISKYPSFDIIYTDGSKEGEKVGCAAVHASDIYKTRLPSIYTAEIQAIDIALRVLSTEDDTDFLICSDSLSVLQALHKRDLSNPFVQKILIRHHNISTSKNFIFSWLPGHVGIQGN
mgnify:CR=1 FL=1